MSFFRRLLRALQTRSRREAVAGWFMEMSVLFCGVPASLEFIREGEFDWKGFAGYLALGLIFAGMGLYWSKEEL